MNEILNYICVLSNKLDELRTSVYDSKELEYAIQKLSEAVYWLSYVKEDLEGEDNE